MLLPSRFYNWSSVMAPSTVTSRSPHPSTAVCSPPVQTDPTSTARFEAASATSASGGPDETPLHEWALQNSGQKNKRHWASACQSEPSSDSSSSVPPRQNVFSPEATILRCLRARPLFDFAASLRLSPPLRLSASKSPSPVSHPLPPRAHPWH